jgi:hypothetical protein
LSTVFRKRFLATVVLGPSRATAHDGGRLLSGGLPQPAEGSIMPMLDKNERARIMFRAEALDRRTHHPGRHSGVLRRTGLAVLKALLFGFHNVATGRCDPSLDSLARLAGCARSTCVEALHRLEAAGLIRRVGRWRAVAGGGRERRPGRAAAQQRLPVPDRRRDAETARDRQPAPIHHPPL